MKTVAIDFDGVIHAYAKGWQDGTCYDIPLPGAIEGLQKLLERYTVFILSTRDPQQIRDWLVRYAPSIETEIVGPEVKFWNKQNVLGITNRKLPAMVYIDDRGYLFRDWTEVNILIDDFGSYPKNL